MLWDISLASYWETVNIMKPSTLTAKLPEVAIIRRADYLCPIFDALSICVQYLTRWLFVSNIWCAEYLCPIFDARALFVSNTVSSHLRPWKRGEGGHLVEANNTFLCSILLPRQLISRKVSIKCCLGHGNLKNYNENVDPGKKTGRIIVGPFQPIYV